MQKCISFQFLFSFSSFWQESFSVAVFHSAFKLPPLTILLQSLERERTLRTMLMRRFPLKTWNMDQMLPSAVTTPWRPFSPAGRQVQKSYCKWQTQEPLIRGLGVFLGPVLPKRSLLKKPMAFPHQNLFGNATGRHHGTLYCKYFST